MNYVKGQFVCLPYLPKFDSVLKYTDTLVYVALRSFDNEFNGCYPAYETIAKRAGCNRLFVRNAIRRLESAGVISVQRSKKIKTVNRYTFTPEYSFDQIPYQFFGISDLSIYEKSMLLNLRRFLRHGPLACLYSIKELATHLGLSYKIVHKNMSSLKSKGYIANVEGRSKNKWKFTDKIGWPWDYNNAHKVKTVYKKLIVG